MGEDERSGRIGCSGLWVVCQYGRLCEANECTRLQGLDVEFDPDRLVFVVKYLANGVWVLYDLPMLIPVPAPEMRKMAE